ncbi:MAG: polymerase sigma factor, sigma-70 family protein [Rhizobium sp.]|nr:polymerase sigma factor, sigma-70 family protein [Rhizobium sp.]
MNSEKRTFDVISQLASLRRYARSLVQSPTEAEDLVHDALVRAYERKETFRAGGNLKSWLLSILHNTHVDKRRSEFARQKRDDAAFRQADWAEGAAQEHSVHLGQIRSAFLELPDEQREALHLVAIEDLSYQQAADALGIPVGTLMSRVSRARARLRAHEDGHGDRPNLRLVGGGHDE